MKRFAVFILILCASAAFGIQARFVSTDALWSWLNNHEVRLDTIENPVWEDLRFPSTGINQTGPAAAPGVDVSAFYGSLEFSGSTLNDVAYQVQLPHAWKNETTVYPHIHIVNGTTSTASSVWELWYRRAEVMGNFGSVWTVATLTAVLTNSTTTHSLKAFAPIDMTGFTDSCMMSMLLRRRTDIAADAHDGIIRLLEFDIHYQTETRGSLAEIGDH